MTLILVSIWMSGCAKEAPVYEVNLETEAVRQTADEEPEKVRMTEAPIVVYVCGEVRSPGVYHLEPGARIIDAVAAAGGFTEFADEDWLNLAESVQDEEKITVYSEETTALFAQSMENTRDEKIQSGLININETDVAGLMQLSGIGKSKAQAIVSYREEHGRFQQIEDIQKVPGIKSSVFTKIKDQITV